MANKINIGNFNNKVLLYRPVQSRTAKGQIVISYELASIAYAEVSPSSSVESIADSNLISAERLQINMFAAAGLNNHWRVGYEDQDYNILSVSSIPPTPFVSVLAEKIIKS